MLNHEQVMSLFTESPQGRMLMGDSMRITGSEWEANERHLRLGLESIEDSPFTKLVKKGTYESYFDETTRCIAERTIFSYRDYPELNPDYTLIIYHDDGYAAISSTPVFNYVNEGPPIISRHATFTQGFYRNAYARAQYVAQASYYLDDGKLAVFGHKNPYGALGDTSILDSGNTEKPTYLKSNIPLEITFEKDLLIFKTRDIKLPKTFTANVRPEVDIAEWNRLATADGNGWRNLVKFFPIDIDIHERLLDE